MSRGGRRPGAGRPARSTHEQIQATGANARARLNAFIDRTGGLLPEISPEILRLTPLEIIRIAMHTAAQDQQWDRAAVLAEKIAPYIHNKLQTITVREEKVVDLRELSTDELGRRIALLSHRVGEIIDGEFEEVPVEPLEEVAQTDK